MRCFATVCAIALLLGSASALAQQVKVNILVAEAPVTGIPDKVFTLITTEWPLGVSTGRHTHPGDEYGTVSREPWSRGKTAENGKCSLLASPTMSPLASCLRPRTQEIHPQSLQCFVVEKGKPRVAPAP
jgi:hypothetical protein